MKLFEKIVVFIYILLLSSCTTTRDVQIPVEVEKIKTEYITKIQKDSIFLHDSINTYFQGDTCYIYKQKVMYKYFTQVDTIVEIDSIPKIVTVKEETVKETHSLTRFQQAMFNLGVIFTFMLVGGVVYYIIKLKNT